MVVLATVAFVACTNDEPASVPDKDPNEQPDENPDKDPDEKPEDPENPDPENPDPENPDPENPDPENPDPENPDPENPDPENPDPENPEAPDLEADNTLRYDWTDISFERTVGSAFMEETPEGVIYTLCVDDVKTYVSYEDTIFLLVEVAGRRVSDSFDLDIATTDETFRLWLCDPIRGMGLVVDSERRTGCSGMFRIRRGVIVCDLSYDAPSGSGDDIEFRASYDGSYRAVNECYDIVYDERESLFVPRSVLLDNRGDEFKIYVSSRENAVTVEAMSDAEVIVTYPADGWATLLKGNFVSGSSHPAMSFTLEGKRYLKGKGDILGMNCQLPMYDAATGRLRLNANLYNERGGVALYYSGSFTILE